MDRSQHFWDRSGKCVRCFTTREQAECKRPAQPPIEGNGSRVEQLEAALRRLVFAAEYCPDANWREVARDDIVMAKWILNNPDA